MSVGEVLAGNCLQQSYIIYGDMIMKKLLMITSTFYPATAHGGPAVSITNMAKALSKYYDVTVVTNRIADELRTETDTSLESDSSAIDLFGCKVFYLGRCSFRRVFEIANDVNPDIVYTSSVFSARFTLPALYYGKSHKNVRTILSPRGELMPNAASRKALKKKLYLLGVRLFGLLRGVGLHVTSEDERVAVKNRYPHNEVFLIKNLVDIKESVTKHPIKQPGSLKVISVGRIHPIKNVDMMIEAIGNCKGNIEYQIYGPKEDMDYYEKCKRLADSLASEKKVKFFGMVDNSKLEEIYGQSQVYLSLTQTENFGISIVEAMSHSCPVVISRNTPWKFAENDECGMCVNIDTIDEAVRVLDGFVELDDERYRRISECAHRWIAGRMTSKEIIDDYLAMFSAKWADEFDEVT